MKRTLLVTLEIDCADLSGEELYEAAEQECVQIQQLERLKDVSHFDLAWIIAGAIGYLGIQMFEGTNTYVKFTEGRVRTSEFIPTVPRKRQRKSRARASTGLPIRDAVTTGKSEGGT